MKSLPVSQARETLADVLGKLDQCPVEITRHGNAIGYIVSPTMFNKISQPAVIHEFSTPGVSGAISGIDDILAVEPAPASTDGPTLSEILDGLRHDRL